MEFNGIYPEHVGDLAQPIPILGQIRNTITVAGGCYQTCVITSNGTVNCFDAHPHPMGVSGKIWWQSVTPEENLVIPLGTSSTAIALSLSGEGPDGAQHCAILDTEELKCWGAGGYGMLGSGNNWDITASGDLGDNLPAIDFGILELVTSLSSGLHHTYALFEQDQVKCWGGNYYGQVGIEKIGCLQYQYRRRLRRNG